MQKRVPIKEYWMVPLISIALAIGLNNIILFSDLARFSPAYQEAVIMLYTPPLWQQILLNGILIPMIEEVIFRGGVMRILRKWMGFIPSMLLSASIFGIYHGNLVQFVYATICGLLLAYLYEVYGSIKAPMLAHISMNVIACVMTETEILEWILSDLVRVIVITFVMASAFVALFLQIKKESKKWLLQKC